MSKSVVVTGAASGIGFACAQSLIEQGNNVLMTDIDPQTLRAAADRLSSDWAVLDVTDEAATDALATKLFAIEAIDGFVASAGVLQMPYPPEQLSMKSWDRLMNVDLRGVYLGCRAFGSRMAHLGSGAIVTISSCAGLRSTPLHAYGPAKAAVISLTQSLAAEWGRSDVRVNGIAPAFTLTEAVINRNGGGDVSAFSRDHLIGRAITPREIAEPVTFLLSEKASAITGITIPVDGGILAAGVWSTYGGIRPPYSCEKPSNLKGTG